MDLNLFRSKLNSCRRPTGESQKALARALGLHPTILSNKLNGTDNARLTYPEIKRLLLILAEWGAFSERNQVNELLELAGLSPWQAFSREEWESSPLNQLRQTSLVRTREPVRLSEPENNQPPAEEVLPQYHKLPTPFNSLIGREGEISQINALLKGTARLVTLTGPAGVGKTRIALEAGRQLLASSRDTAFTDGVVWVDLAPVNNPALVVGIIARSLNIQEKAEELLLDTLKAALRGRQLLVILDNFEQIVVASALLSELLASAPALKFLVTSRETLQLYSEYPFLVEPWPLPALSVNLPLDGIISNPAVQLFIQRARVVKPDFALTLQNALEIVHICLMLDSLPLAIELAAARIRLFSPGEIVAKLSQSLAFLQSQWRDVPPRQQALWQAFNWSYELLNQKEKQLFRSLGVFRGSFSLEAAAAISGNGPAENCPDPEQQEVIAGWLAQLVGKSLVRSDYQPGESQRFVLLETLRQFALEKLKENEELARLSRRHAVYYLGQVESTVTLLSGPEAEAGLATLDREYTNIEAVLDWCQAQNEILIGYRLSVGLVNYWKIRGYAGEGWRWFEQILRLPFSLEDENNSQLLPWRAKILSKAGNFATFRNDYYRATSLHEEALGLNRLIGNKAEIAFCLNNLGVVRGYYQKYFDEGIELFEASLAIQRELDNGEKVASIYNNLGLLAMRQNNYRKALTTWKRVWQLATSLTRSWR